MNTDRVDGGERERRGKYGCKRNMMGRVVGGRRGCASIAQLVRAWC